MEKEDVPPSAPAWYPGPGTSDVTGRPTYVDVDTMPEIKIWFLHHKWRQWFRILDADQDGIISADDMEKTNAKLEQIRLLVNFKDSAPSEEEQRKWWNDHVFKRGPGEDISLEDYISYLEGFAEPDLRPVKFLPIITQFFDFFSTEEYRKKKLILGERDFVKFWTILVNIDERHCKYMFIKHVPSPLTLASLLDDFVALVSHDDVLNNDNYRLLAVLKQNHNGCCSNPDNITMLGKRWLYVV
ncbi:sarcoplasmic calcium-binding protein-like isoform X2 [Saccostrea cucullata]|uniref:sarcoplasmic calcium-binding protein-like isoform X2 n=1 Tax=Saccostrea cuccullata TaxID=36930 RepID=UPI002ED1F9B9